MKIRTLDESIGGGFTGPVLMNKGKPPEGTGLANLTVTAVVPAFHEVVFVLKVSQLFLVVKAGRKSSAPAIFPADLGRAGFRSSHKDSRRE